MSQLLVLHQGAPPHIRAPGEVKSEVHYVQLESWCSGRGMERILDATETDFLFLSLPGSDIELGRRTLERFLTAAHETGAGLVYSDFREELGDRIIEHSTIDYHTGSIRDTFDFGGLVLVSMDAARVALAKYGPITSALHWAGFYDLRLKVSTDFPVVRIPEPLYTTKPPARSSSGLTSAAAETVFDYVDPKNRDYQLEMEQVATAHLRRIGSFLEPEFSSPPPPEPHHPVMASLIIPVRNRERTIADAVHSALTQSAPFTYNVIVVDNHSTDRTTEIVRRLARRQPNLVHKIPRRTDLGIGGCWNEAIESPECGLFALQLDSDDLYADAHTLEKMIRAFWEPSSSRRSFTPEAAPRYAMVIGSYTTVNFDLEEIPPGLVDHREWTRENGRNNLLRINGLGAPRAFYVPVLRRIGFPNVSYGEDYAVALRLSREYEIGRLFEPVYLARRWEENSDHALPQATLNRYDAYKDWLRTVEILARRKHPTEYET